VRLASNASHRAPFEDSMTTERAANLLRALCFVSCLPLLAIMESKAMKYLSSIRRPSVPWFAVVLLVATCSIAAVTNYRLDSACALDISQAAQLYGAACDSWDDDGSGCGVGGCLAECHKFSSSSSYHDSTGVLSSTNCTQVVGGGGPGSCGVFENVDQSQCGS
jgi:hypothetical protein